jgi:hypothetical protein
LAILSIKGLATAYKDRAVLPPDNLRLPQKLWRDIPRKPLGIYIFRILPSGYHNFLKK